MESSSLEVTDKTKPPFDISLRKSIANRLDHLYEISHIPKDSKISITDFPIVNPYTVFDKPQASFKKSIKKFLGPSHPSIIKEYVQTSKFDQFNIPASETENFIILALPREFVIPWQKQGCTHLHFDAVRLALTFHGRKGLPVVSRISLLNSRFLEYQNAVIGTVQTTLNAGTIFVTLFPSFKMSLKDPHLCDALIGLMLSRISNNLLSFKKDIKYIARLLSPSGLSNEHRFSVSIDLFACI